MISEYDIRHYAWDQYVVVETPENEVSRMVYVGPLSLCDKLLDILNRVDVKEYEKFLDSYSIINYTGSMLG